MSPEELAALSKKVKWKADKRLIGMAWIMYVLNYFDRVSRCRFPGTIPTDQLT
jgi:hypothetical protein